MMLAPSVRRTLVGAWRRAILLPLRLGLVVVMLIGLLGTLGYNALQAARLEMQRHQMQTLRGLPGWSIELESTEEDRLVPWWNVEGLDDWLRDGQPALLQLRAPVLLRIPGEREDRIEFALFATDATGLGASDGAGGLWPCAWLGPPLAPGIKELEVHRRWRCRLVVRPEGWQSLDAQMLGAAIALPLEALPQLLGRFSFGQIGSAIVGRRDGCESLPEAPPMAIWRCERLASAQSAMAAAAHELSLWQQWSTPLALALLGLALLLHLHGQLPITRKELALRRALGVPDSGLMAWLVWDTMVQLLFVIAVPAILAVLSLHAFSHSLTAHDELSLLIAVPTGGLAVLAWMLLLVWAPRNLAMSRLIREDH